MTRALLVLAMGAMALPIGCVADPSKTITEKDFKTDAERVAYLQQFVPMQIPPEAGSIRIRMVQWQDWNLKASFVLPKEAFARFGESLATLEPAAEGRRRFESKDRPSVGAIEIVPRTRQVKLSCTNPPGQ